LLCDSRLRWPLTGMLSRTIKILPVIAYDEIVLGTDVEPIETISIRETKQQENSEQQQPTVALNGVAQPVT
jgi:hypothetical protein